MESPTPLANRTNAADTPVDAKNILKTRLRPKPPTVLSPLAKDFEPVCDADDDSNDEDFVYDAQKEGKLKGASEQWTRGKRPNGIDDAAPSPPSSTRSTTCSGPKKWTPTRCSRTPVAP